MKSSNVIGIKHGDNRLIPYFGCTKETGHAIFDW